MRRWPPVADLDAYGPELEVPSLAQGDRVRCWAGLGIVESIGRPFNGVEGIHAYAGIRLDNGNSCSAKLDELEPSNDPAPIFGAVPEGAMF